MEENTEQRIDLTLFSEKIQGLKERIASVIVGQVTVSEEGQRELAQHLCQPDAAVGAFPVGGFV